MEKAFSLLPLVLLMIQVSACTKPKTDDLATDQMRLNAELESDYLSSKIDVYVYISERYPSTVISEQEDTSSTAKQKGLNGLSSKSRAYIGPGWGLEISKKDTLTVGNGTNVKTLSRLEGTRTYHTVFYELQTQEFILSFTRGSDEYQDAPDTRITVPNPGEFLIEGDEKRIKYTDSLTFTWQNLSEWNPEGTDSGITLRRLACAENILPVSEYVGSHKTIVYQSSIVKEQIDRDLRQFILDSYHCDYSATLIARNKAYLLDPAWGASEQSSQNNIRATHLTNSVEFSIADTHSKIDE